MRLYGPLVARWCRASDLQPADADDVAQEVLKEAVGRLPDFHRERPGSLRAWLKKVTRSKIADRGRDRVPGGVGVGGDDPPALETAPARADGPETDPPAEPDEELVLLRQAVEMVLDEFQPATREAYLRVVLHGQAPNDVARDLGLTPNAVYLARSRVKRRLREEFAGLIEM
jgi:RNA polymerase sigma-70 factor (ECF subfamily)